MMQRIETPFGFSSTADEVVAGIDLSGRRAIITGSSSGIGIETARALAAAGPEVTLAVRNTAAAARVATDITTSRGTRPAVYMPRQSHKNCGVERTLYG